MEREYSFGPALRRMRLARGLPQDAFATTTTQAHLSRLERGVREPTWGKVTELAVKLEVHPLTLFALSYLVTDEASSVDELLETVKRELNMLGVA